MRNNSVQLLILDSVKKSLVRGRTCNLLNLTSEVLRIFKMLDEKWACFRAFPGSDPV